LMTEMGEMVKVKIRSKLERNLVIRS